MIVRPRFQRALLAILVGLAARAAPAIRADDGVVIDPEISAEARAHWSFQPLVRPAVPVRDGATEIDRFIGARLAAAGLDPAPRADRETLIRRLSFDLVGVPPAPRDIDRFLADEAPGAWERLVDRLLASPAYGERWAQHWLDLARYADTDGFEHDNLRPEAWRYRDWVIGALNRDLPYDAFIRQQLAGDLLAPDDSGAITATGFALAGPDMPDINRQDERAHMVLSDITATVGAVILGLEFGCAQCHDHKWDPISIGDFYRLRANFETAELFAGHSVTRPEDGAAIELRAFAERSGPARVSHVRLRGDFARLGPEIAAGFPRVLGGGGPEGDARRLALGEWLTRADHPLTARVAANRVWQHFFGRGIVATPNDFGLRGAPPTHPELLDWLATELVRSEWSLKRLHRVIVTSDAYRRASRSAVRPGTPGADRESWDRLLAKDPANVLLGRQSRRRLEAEAIRDAVLEVAGLRSVRAGGPGVMPPLPEEIRRSIRKDHWRVSPDPEDHFRRSVYLFARRNLEFPFLAVFDRPQASAPCGRRSTTTVAPQSLALFNSALSRDAAGALAARTASTASCDDRVEAVYRIALGRRPSTEEAEAALALVRDVAALDASSEEDGWTSLCLALLNVGEFVWID